MQDITSHELRNLLSAILQSAESIVQDIQRYQKSNDALDTNSVLESARTIFFVSVIKQESLKIY